MRCTAFLVFLLAGAAKAQVTWTRVTTTAAPAARTDSPLAFDVARQRAVLFGGFDRQGAALGDTWEWDGSQWTQRFPTTSPPARGAHGLCYDSRRNVVVLFGGALHGGVCLADTWEWNGTNWIQAQPLRSPPARCEHAQAFDEYQAIGRVFVMGGTTQRGNAGLALGDFWSYDGTTWVAESVVPAPGPRCGAAMTYSHTILGLVLFGGRDRTGALLGDTWERSAGYWMERPTVLRPPARAGHGLVYDFARHVNVLHGGILGGFETWDGSDTWEWNSLRWTQRAVDTQPGYRNAAGVTFERGKETMLLFGGERGIGAAETWTYGPVVRASVTSFGSGCAKFYGVPDLTSLAGSRPWLGETVELRARNVSTWVPGKVWGSLGFSKTVWNGQLLPLRLDGYGMPGCSLYGSLDVVVPLVRIPTESAITWSIAIPNASVLAGVHAYAQVWPFEAFDTAVVGSNALDLGIGTR